jgi:GDP-L-fucose synthase
MLNKNSKIFVAGHKGLVGSAIVRELIKKGYKNILTINRKNIDLKNQKKYF